MQQLQPVDSSEKIKANEAVSHLDALSQLPVTSRVSSGLCVAAR